MSRNRRPFIPGTNIANDIFEMTIDAFFKNREGRVVSNIYTLRNNWKNAVFFLSKGCAAVIDDEENMTYSIVYVKEYESDQPLPNYANAPTYLNTKLFEIRFREEMSEFQEAVLSVCRIYFNITSQWGIIQSKYSELAIPCDSKKYKNALIEFHKNEVNAIRSGQYIINDNYYVLNYPSPEDIVAETEKMMIKEVSEEKVAEEITNQE